MPPMRRPPVPCAAWAYFLDLDGTLIDIASSPQNAVVDTELKALIERLHHTTAGAVAVISGRALADLDLLLGSLQVPMTGQHGLERRDPAGKLWTHATTPAIKSLIQKAMAPILARHPDLLLEDKGLSLALHYRTAPHLAPYVRRLMTRLAAAAGPAMELQHGKCVVEIRPTGTDKGTAVAEYLGEKPFRDRRPVFIGDDVNDEMGFAAVNKRSGISIKVGGGRSCAHYRLGSVPAVRRWLEDMLQGTA